MKYIAIMFLAWLGINQAGRDSYVCRNARIMLFSEAPLEDIAATSGKGTSVYNPATGDLAFSVPIRSFAFEKSLMQEHFNENYMESDKFPNASFRGKVLEKIDVSKDGIYPVKASGVLEVHGVKQNRTIDGKVQVNKGAVRLSSTFNVRCKDHQIDIPKLVFQKIAESIEVKVAADYSKYQK
ncbi:YceI family protein [Arcticibacter sp. MXS-1]|uniref:YceI family protein n=1 Tax=Arcticibacter sp. MXS-1 TaxID=3341726 RepID=UPI0035A92FEE